MKDIKGFFFRNYKAKLSVFLIAVFLWVFIMIRAEYDATFNIPLETVGKKPNKVLVERIPETVKVQCKDTGKQLLMFQFFSDATLRLDLSTINYFFDYPLDISQLHLPGGFYPRLMHIIDPDTVHIRLDDLERVKVPIWSRAKVVPKAGYVLMEPPKLSLDSVTVKGARRFTRTITSISTDSVVFEGVTGDFRASVPLMIEQEGLEYNVNEIEIQATVDRLGQIVIPRVPIRLESVPVGKQVTAEPPQVNLTVKGAVSLLKKLRDDSVRVVIDFRKEWRPEVKNYEPKVALPGGVELISIAPKSVKLNVKKTG